jgi:integrase
VNTPGLASTLGGTDISHHKTGLTLGAFLQELWLPGIKPTVRYSTHRGYHGIVRNHIDPALGRLSLKSVSPQRLNGFYAELLAHGHCLRGTGLSPTTVIRVHATIHRALRDAVRWGYISTNPADKADPPKQKMGGFELRTWDVSELQRFLDAASKTKEHPMWLLYAMTGMRRGEVLGLRWKDVDIDRGLISIRQTVLNVGGDRVFSTPKTSRSRRVVALDPNTTATLKAAWGASNSDPSALIFCEEDGSPLDGNTITRRFVNLAASAGLPRIRLHDLRHTHATLALGLGIHPKIVSERLGHSTIAFTLDIYSHATPHMQSEAALKIGQLVSAPVGR